MQKTTKTLIEGKIARILNDRELVINRGSDHGVEVGMKFEVVEEYEEILDPDTKESLGSIRREKIGVKIVHVEPKLSIGRTYETYQASPGLPAALAGVASLYGPVTKVRTLRQSEASPQPFDDVNSYINIGDKIIQLDEGYE